MSFLVSEMNVICPISDHSLDLWILLQNEAMRQRLRDYIVEHKLGGEDRGLLKVAENLGLLAGLLLAVA